MVVLADAPNNAPVISSAAPTVARVGLPLFYDVVAEDQNSDPLSYELINGPAGAVIEDNRLVWTPDSSELGQVREFELAVSDGRDGQATQSFQIEVISQSVNSAPRILSVPDLTARQDRLYSYDLAVEDVPFPRGIARS